MNCLKSDFGTEVVVQDVHDSPLCHETFQAFVADGTEDDDTMEDRLPDSLLGVYFAFDTTDFNEISSLLAECSDTEHDVVFRDLKTKDKLINVAKGLAKTGIRPRSVLKYVTLCYAESYTDGGLRWWAIALISLASMCCCYCLCASLGGG